MKAYNRIYKTLKVISLIAMTVALANCGKSDNNGNTANTALTMSNGVCMQNGVTTALQNCQSVSGTYYGWVGSACYQVGSNAYTNVATSYCANVANYQLIGSQCYQVINNQQTPVASTYCSSVNGSTGPVCNSSTGNYGNAQAQSCNGLYYGAYNTPVQCSSTMACGQTTQASNGWTSVVQMNCSGMILYNGMTGQTVYCQ